MVSPPCVALGSHVTLHYRIAVLHDGDEHEVVSTFESSPATLQLGASQISPPLETRLLGLVEGQEATFDLDPDESFGPRSAELVQTMSRSAFDQNAEASDYLPGDVVEFNSPGGDRFAGVLKSHAEEAVVVDFNHPLAGLPLRFSVRVIGVL